MVAVRIVEVFMMANGLECVSLVWICVKMCEGYNVLCVMTQSSNTLDKSLPKHIIYNPQNANTY